MEDDLSSIRLQLQQIQKNLTTAKDLMESENSHINNTVYMLSMSLNDSQQVNSDKLQQLNSSINEAKTQLSDKFQELNAMSQAQLNVSIDQLNRSLNSQQASLIALNSSIRMNHFQHSDSLNELRCLHLGQTQALPVSSCVALNDLPRSFPSGYYWVRVSNGSAVRVYCDMTRSCGGVTGGWMRVAELDMTNSSHQCPNHLEETTSSSRRICRINSSLAACSPAIAYSTVLEYSKVCGRIRAFKTGDPDGFIPYGIREQNPTIADNYVDGVSLTHSRPRQHIWTFAARPFGCTCVGAPT
jgi:small-conductance mechanosensitive channel